MNFLQPQLQNHPSSSPVRDHRNRLQSGLQLGMILVALLMVLATILSFQHAPVVVVGLIFNRVTCTLGLLVTMVGAVVVRYADRYLDGDPNHGRFSLFLALSVLSALCMMLADNLLVLVAGWSLTSLGLHYLLTHYRHEPDAVAAARKKFVISRLGDVALIFSVVAIYQTWNTLSLTHALEFLRTSPQPPVAVVWGICVAAITKSAQFPFHSWLPDTLASPTPVSALMHAGIINGGGALLLKFAPALVEVPSAGLFLSIVGSVTMAIGMLSMGGQTSVKRKLAWSTVGQMGFMTAEFGIAAFGAALVHLVGHGLYKANAFLSSGSLETAATRNRLVTLQSLNLIVTGALVSLPVQFSLHRGDLDPGQWAIVAMTGLAVGHCWVAVTRQFAAAHRLVVGAMLLLSSQLLAGLAAVTLRLTSQAFDLPHAHPSATSTFAAAIPVVTLVGLTFYSVFQPAWSQFAQGKALKIHAQNGFYVGLLADKLVSKIWTPASQKAL